MSHIGSIMYAVVCIPINISQAISVVSHYIANAGKVHQQAVKQILWYLYDTKNVSLVYDISTGINSSVIGYVNSDNAGNLEKIIF